VDIVADGGTNRSLFESQETTGDSQMKTTLREIMASVLEAGTLTSKKSPDRPSAKIIAQWKSLLEEDAYGGMAMDSPMTTPPAATDAAAPPPPDATADGGMAMSHEDHLAHMLKAIVQDEGLSADDKIDKITKALKLLEEKVEKGGEGDMGDMDDKGGEGGEADVKESKKDKPHFEAKERQEYLQLKAEKGCRELCESLQYMPDKIDMMALVGMSTDDDRKAYIRKLKDIAIKTAAAATTPMTQKKVTATTGVTSRVLESTNNNVPVPGGAKDDAARKVRAGYWKN
jgi:hypothetical protein